MLCVRLIDGGNRLYSHKETTMRYQGKTVQSRPAKEGDQGFDASKGEQVVITLADGTEKTVAKAEVTE